MRDVPHIWEAWRSGGPYVGDYKPCTKVTVEAAYHLNLSNAAPKAVNLPWYDCAFDDSGWGFAKELVIQSQTIAGAGTWGPGLTAFSAHGPTWPNGSDWIIGPSSGTTGEAPVGSCYFGQHFTSGAGTHLIYVCADNVVDLWLDGTHIWISGDLTTNGRIPVTLTAGTHCIKAKVLNGAQLPPAAPTQSNPLGFLCSVWTCTGLTPVTEICSTDGTWKILEYPAKDPADTTPHGEMVGTWKNGPARWFQRADATQIETVVPNVVQVDTQKSVRNDAQTANITIVNTVTDQIGEIPELDDQFGKPGFYTWTRGESQEAKARWGHVSNEWNQVLVPNALIRTYQGFGGHDKTVKQAVLDGNLVCTGVWLVDTVDITSSGDLKLSCRDMGKLLVDQQMFPPLVPKSLYPLKYYRYTYENFTVPPVPTPGPVADLDAVIMRYKNPGDAARPFPNIGTTSSSDVVAGGWNAPVYGHHPTDAFDANFTKNDPRFVGASLTATNPYNLTQSYTERAHDDTYWLSDDPADGTVYLEFATDGREVNRIHIEPWGGNYMCHVSVMENGGWVSSEDGGYTGGMISTATNTKNVPYIWKSGIAWEQDNEIFLPRVYRADKIRLTFTNLIPAGVPGGKRCGIRQIAPLMDHTHAHLYFGVPVDSLCFAAAPYPHINLENHVGYWQGRDDGEVFAFGDCRTFPAGLSNPVNQLDGRLITIAAMPSGQGYYRLDQFGRVVAHGSAVHHGDLFSQGLTDITDMAVTPSGNGYWLLRRNGVVTAFGDAVHHGNGAVLSGTPFFGTAYASPANFAQRIRSHPTDAGGYWILYAHAEVEAIGTVTSYGNGTRPHYNPVEPATDLRIARNGDGYWILSSGGKVEARGSIVPDGDLGNGKTYPVERWVQGLCWTMVPSVETDAGYGVFHADGDIDQLGDFYWGGSIGQGGGQIRKDGNYKDYLDIIKELLLWSGFYLYRDPQPDEFPDVYGLLESTGSFSTTDLPAEMFDKVPVIQPITGIKEALGYIFYIDDEGGARFQSPNWWSMGNYDFNGVPLDIMPEIDEKLQMVSYSIQFNDTNARSEITIANENPEPTIAGQPPITKGIISTVITPPSAADLKGMVKPAMWTNGLFTDEAEQKAMADLIAMHIWFARRVGNTTCVANPLIGIDDQVRIYERTTGETYVHYVSDVSTSHDLRSGSYTMQLGTYWLGGSPYNQPVSYYASAPLPGDAGYLQVNSFGDVYTFGNAQLRAKNDPLTHIAPVVGARFTATGAGYWTVDTSGKVISYGDAVNYGGLTVNTTPRAAGGAGVVTDMAVTPTGAGYWLLQEDGTVTPFGDAPVVGNGSHVGTLVGGQVADAVSIETDGLTSTGYWVLWGDGHVEGVSLADHGSHVGAVTPAGRASSIRRTNTGNGYWITFFTGTVTVEAHGDAANLGGEENDPPDLADRPAADKSVANVLPDYQLGATAYAVSYLDGILLPLGSFPNLGQAGGGGAGHFDWVFATPAEASNRPAGTVIPVSSEVVDALKRGSSPSAKNAVAAGFKQPTGVTMKG